MSVAASAKPVPLALVPIVKPHYTLDIISDRDIAGMVLIEACIPRTVLDLLRRLLEESV